MMSEFATIHRRRSDLRDSKMQSCLAVMIVIGASAACWLPARAEESKSHNDRLQPIPISKLKRPGRVDFGKEILPVLKNNCLACHNKTTAKARLILETPADMIRGGESGPAVKPGKSGSSLLLKAASHQLEDTVMPPPGNKVQASDLTPDELALIRLWIDQGAVMSSAATRTLEWQPLPPGLTPIYAVALTSDGQYAACARANQIFVYHLPTSRLVSRLEDPDLQKSNGGSGVAHRDLVHSLAFNADGSLLASGGFREVKLWRRAPDVTAFRITPSSPGAVSTAAVSPDGKWFATGGNDGSLRIWTLATGKRVVTLPRHKGAVTSVAFSADSTLLCSGSADHTLHVWRVPDGELVGQAVAATGITSVKWFHESVQIASGGEDSLVRIWELDREKKSLNGIRELQGHAGPVTTIDILPSGQILSGGADGTVRLWDASDGSQLRQMKHGSPVTAVAVRPDSKRFASAGLDHVTKYWNAADGSLVAELKGERHAQENVAELERTVAFAKSELDFNHASLKSAETNQVAQNERVKKATEADEKAAKSLSEKQSHFAEVKETKNSAEQAAENMKTELKKANESLELAENAVKQAEADTASTKSLTATETKTAAAKLVSELKEKDKQAAEKLKSASKSFKDAEAELKKAEQSRSSAETELQLANKALNDSDKKIADAKSSVEKAQSAQEASEAALKYAGIRAAEFDLPVRTIAFSPDNLTLASAGEDRMIHTWSADQGRPFETKPGRFGPVLITAFTSTNLLLSAGADGSVELWRLDAPWTLARTIGTGDSNSPLADRVNALKFGPDGKLLATGGGEPTRGGEIILWDIATGKPARSFTNVHSDAVFALDFSRDGTYLATGGADRFGKVIALDTGKVVRQFEGHSHHVLGISWKGDGRTLATAGADNVIKTWDFPGGDRKKNITGFDKEVTSISFVGYSDQALATSGDGKVRLIRDNGEEVRTFSGPTDFVYSAAATPDGKIVIAGGQDGILRVWNGTDGRLIAAFSPNGNN